MLLVGAGCIGCEHLKNWALMGVGSNQPSGLVTVVDMDTVDVHHLNSQLLYNRNDISVIVGH
jgi:ubiquitin-activating enzyme E1